MPLEQSTTHQKLHSSSSSSSSVALQPGGGPWPPSQYASRPLDPLLCLSPFVYPHLSHIRGHVIQPSHFWSSSSSCCIQLSVQHLFRNCGVLHSFYVTKPSYSFAFNEPDNVLPLNYRSCTHHILTGPCSSKQVTITALPPRLQLPACYCIEQHYDMLQNLAAAYS